MARVLIGWELGANRGHISVILSVAERLLGEGHAVAIALQQIDAGGLDLDPRISLFQAPVWPRLLVSIGQSQITQAATMGDILCRLGLDRQGCLAAMIAGWDSICAGFKPDLVIADFAPALLTAAQGRTPTIRIGDGFISPPGDMARFPSLTGAPASFDEEFMLDLVDADLAQSGRAPLPGLPALFAADHELVSSFALLDPYATKRNRPNFAPLLKPPVPESGGATGEEIFVYAYQNIGAEMALWDGLALTGKNVRVHMPGATPEHRARFSSLGIKFEAEPVPFPAIAARSRIVVSHGGHGFVSSALLAGIPQMIMWYDVEKQLHGRAIAAAGLGRDQNLFAIMADAFASALNDMWADPVLAKRCIEMSPGFQHEMKRDALSQISEIAR
jgi:rhamnosyltransferase subunit B